MELLEKNIIKSKNLELFKSRGLIIYGARKIFKTFSREVS